MESYKYTCYMHTCFFLVEFRNMLVYHSISVGI